MSDGWIKINRKITEMQGYFGERFSRVQCWIDLLLLAEWKDGRVFYVRGNKVVVNRGEVAIPLTELCERWGLAKLTVRKRLQEFVDNEMITIKHTRVINVISIINYEKYQSVENGYDNELGQKSGTNAETKSNQQKKSESNYNTSSYKMNDPQNDPQNDPLSLRRERNNIIITDITRTRKKDFQAFISELKQSAIWMEQMQMRFHITNPDELMAWIDKFALDAECRGKEYNNVSDVKQHFNNWLIIQQKIENDAKDRKDTKIQRRGFEGSVGKAEDYTTTF